MKKIIIYILLCIVTLIFIILGYLTKPIVFHPTLLQVMEKEDIIGSELLSDLEQAQRSKHPIYILCKPYELTSNFKNLNVAVNKSDDKKLICIGAAAKDVIVEPDDLTPRGNKYYVSIEFGEITGKVYIYSYENDKFMLVP
jgi:hypothetical protein